MTDGYLPYARQVVDEDDIQAVADVLRSDWLTTGPAVDRFESAFADFVEANHAVAVSSGTAALHLAMLAAGVGPGDEVIVPAMTFVASANCARYVGADVVFADVRDDTLTIDVDHVESLITSRSKAIVAVDYAGTPCDLHELRVLADRHALVVIEDAAHAPGATYRDRKVGGISHLSTFSFHPVKPLTTGEGGMVTTNDESVARRLRRLRNHGIDLDSKKRSTRRTWVYDVAELGFNYRMPDINCALGMSQLSKLPGWIATRRELANRYSDLFRDLVPVRPLFVPADRESAWHLYPIRIDAADPAGARQQIFDHLRSHEIGVNVHYLPVYLHSEYQRLGYRAGLCPVAEAAYLGLLSLPLWPGLRPGDQDRVVTELARGIGGL